jgi:hypothetical protein
LERTVESLEDQWTSGLMLEFIATRDIQPGEEVFINYGDEWQKAWDEHVKNWEAIPPEKDYNNLTLWAQETAMSSGKDGYVRAEVFNTQIKTPIRTVDEQKTDPYPQSLELQCLVRVGWDASYLTHR